MMARPTGSSLNELFTTLATWNECLSKAAPDIFPPQPLKQPHP